MISNDFLFRTLAVLAAALVVAGPLLVAAMGRLRLPARAVSPEKDDAHTVIEIARRLQSAGNTEGVSLCQKLLEVLLRPAGGVKK